MKAKLIRTMAKLIRNPDGTLKRDPEGHPEGTVIEGPKAYILVRQGVAEPADEECAKAAGMTPEAFEKAKYAYERLSRRVAPEDFAAYDRGLMIGYKPDAKEGDSWIHGPNWTEGCEREYYESLDEADDE